LDYFGLTRPRPDEQSRVRVMSFSPVALRRVHRLAPGLPTVLLMERIWPWRRSGSLPRDVPIAGISVAALLRDPGYVDRVKARGGQVHVWTVDDPVEVDACLAAGVAAIISNRPAMVTGRIRSLLQDRG
ncbi:MAG: glycerophosphodiester phosphodiesterase, partial [Actinomycetales bacterium]